MKMFEDGLIELDYEAVTIKQRRRGIRTRRIPYSDIRGVEQFPLRTGRYRLTRAEGTARGGQDRNVRRVDG